MGQRRRVLGTIAVASLPLLLLAAVSAWRGVADAESSIVEERITLARAAALATASFVNGNLSTLTALTHTRTLTDRSEHPHLAGLLEQIRVTDPSWDVLGLADSDGWNIEITGLEPRTVNTAELAFFRQVQSTGQPVVTPAFIGRLRNIPLIALAVPVDFTTGGRGVLSGSLALDRLREELRALLGDSSIRVVVLDSQGQVFVHPDPDVAQILPSLRGRADADAALAGQTGSQRVLALEGGELLSAYAPVPNTGWAVMVQQPTAAAFDVVRRQLAVALGLLGLAAALTGLVGWSLADRLSLYYQRQLEARALAETAARELSAVSAESEGRRRFLEELIDAAPVAIAVLQGPEHRFASINERYQAIKPTTPMLGRTVAEVFPEIVPQGAVELLDQVYDTGEQFTAADARFDLDDGTGDLQPRFFTLVLSRYDGPDGRPQGVLIIAPETTGAVQARRLAERDKDEFLSIASHELKTPLTSLALAAQMIDRMLKRGQIEPARLERHVGTITVQTARATQLITELLDVSRIDAGQLDLRRGPVDLVALAAAAAQRERDALPENATHEIVETVTGAPLIVEGDEARLDQVLTNLLSNAVKYSPRGGRVELRLTRENGHAIVAVADRGIGIPPAERDRLFAPFGRTAAARLSGIEGTGLGLYISRRIVEAHGGTIAVEDTPGGGTTFVVRLPLHDEAARDGEPTRNGQAARPDGARDQRDEATAASSP